MSKQLQIRNSTAEFLIFQAEDKSEGVQVFYKDESICATQKAMAMLFDCSTDNISLHLKNIFESGELIRESVTEKISATAADGKNYLTQFYKIPPNVLSFPVPDKSLPSKRKNTQKRSLRNTVSFKIVSSNPTSTDLSCRYYHLKKTLLNNLIRSVNRITD